MAVLLACLRVTYHAGAGRQTAFGKPFAVSTISRAHAPGADPASHARQARACAAALVYADFVGY